MDAKKKEGVWRFNADPVWLQVTSMFQESHHASVAPHDFARQHHTRACLYFAVGAVEAFLNREMRKKLEREGVPENRLLERLRYIPLLDRKKTCKARHWPEELAGSEVVLSTDFYDVLDATIGLRNEATHPKGRDHSLYMRIDQSHTAPP